MTVYVEFLTSIGTAPNTDRGEVRYLLRATEGQEFDLQAGYDGDSEQFGLFAYTRNITTDPYPLGTNITLGFNVNGTTVFKLSGDSSNFTISQDATPPS